MPRHLLTIAHTARLDAAPDAAYAQVADGRGRPRWLGELRATDAPERPLQVGDRVRGRTSLLLHSFAGVSEVIRAEPGDRLVEEVVVGARFTSTWTFREDGAGTVVSHLVELDFPAGPLGRIERWILRRRLGAMQRASLAALANLRQ